VNNRVSPGKKNPNGMPDSVKIIAAIKSKLTI
jgi:hypothetical protein